MTDRTYIEGLRIPTAQERTNENFNECLFNRYALWI